MSRLVRASSVGNVDEVSLALRNGANVDRRSDGETALTVASRNGHVECVRLLLDKADVDRASNTYGWTALMLASRHGHVECVRALLDKADVDRTDKYGNTALMIASQNGHVECVRLLLDKAEVNRADKYRMTALMFASHHGHVDCVCALLEAGATDDDGRAMIPASQEGHVAVLELLIHKFKPKDFAMAVLQWSAVSCAKMQMDDATLSQAQAVFVTKLAQGLCHNSHSI